MPVLGTVVDGLWIGTATVSTGNRDAMFGVPVGWDRTSEGAVAAAMNIDAASYELPSIIDSSAAQLNRRLYTGTALEEMTNGTTMKEFRAAVRKRANLNDAGVVLDSQGNPSPEERYFGGAIPEYGAYKIVDVKTNSDSLISEVTVWVFQPFYRGVGTETDVSNVKVFYRPAGYVMTWVDNDWKASSWTPDSDFSFIPDPKIDFTNQGFAWIREQLGEGWAVPADGTEQSFPGAVKTR